MAEIKTLEDAHAHIAVLESMVQDRETEIEKMAKTNDELHSKIAELRNTNASKQLKGVKNPTIKIKGVMYEAVKPAVMVLDEKTRKAKKFTGEEICKDEKLAAQLIEKGATILQKVEK